MTGKVNLVFVSILENDPSQIGEVCSELSRKYGVELEYYGIDGDSVDSDVLKYHELVKRTKAADAVFIKCAIGLDRFKSWDKYSADLSESEAVILVHSGNEDYDVISRNLFKGTDEQFQQFKGYAKHICEENDRGLFLWILDLLGFSGIPVPEPIVPPNRGLYLPSRENGITKEELVNRLDPGKITIGVLFTARQLVYGDRDHIDALIKEIEKQGMNAFPVFYSKYSSAGDDSPVEAICDYFTDGGKPLIDCLISTTRIHFYHDGEIDGDDHRTYRERLNVPIIFAISVPGQYADFEQDKIGLSKTAIRTNVVYPELDGCIIGVPVCYRKSGQSGKRSVPIPDRINHIVRLAGNWGRLRHKPPEARRVAILMWQYRPGSDNIGYAGGLDTLESISDILRELKEKRYVLDHVPADGKELISEILAHVTNDVDMMPDDRIGGTAADLMDTADYKVFFDVVPEWDREQIVKQWGEPPGEVCVYKEKLVIPGIVNGNVFIGYQPVRGWGVRKDEDLHDPLMFTQHQYLAYYRWIRDVFGADIVYHMGTHGSLEWLPGKNVGLSEKCNPDIILDAMPNVYPYVIDDPGEGIQAKRRIESVLDGYLPPSMARAGSYKELDEVNTLIQDYLKRMSAMDEAHRKESVSTIFEAARNNNLLNDIGYNEVDGPGDFMSFIVPLHEYIEDVKDTLIRADMHILGRVPAGHHLDETVYSMMRLDNGSVKSIRTSFANSMGVDLESVKNSICETSNGLLNSEIVDDIDGKLMTLLAWMREDGYNTERTLEHLKQEYCEPDDSLKESITYVCETLVPNILAISNELSHLLEATEGQYVRSGPSGAPTRGNADVLPTGTNFYSIDPDAIPTKAAWASGSRMAEQMVSDYAESHGCYPREVGIILWATDTMKTGGDDVAYILRLMGVRPVWSKTGGQVTDLEVIPLSELGRPRADVTVSITGLFRDTFPLLIDLIDRAVSMVTALQESSEDNAMADNYRKAVAEDLAEGIPEDEARLLNAVRVFGAPPGGYGTGANVPLENGSWIGPADFADVYRDWISYGYSQSVKGRSVVKQFRRRFDGLEVTVKNVADREIDLLDCDDFYQYLGGMNAYIRAYGKHKADYASYMTDDSDPSKSRIRSAKEELMFVFRSKVLNPKFINGLMEHGYRGAGEMVNITKYTLAWGATSAITEEWMFRGLADKYLLNEEVREWMKEVNPYAILSLIDTLKEAADHGMWNLTEEYLEKMSKLYLEVDEIIESITDL